MAEKDAFVVELKASQEKSLTQASALHVKELETLQSQVDKLNQELSSSKEKTEHLKKMVSDLQPYKERSQVRSLSFLMFLWLLLVIAYILAFNRTRLKGIDTLTPPLNCL